MFPKITYACEAGLSRQSATNPPPPRLSRRSSVFVHASADLVDLIDLEAGCLNNRTGESRSPAMFAIDSSGNAETVTDLNDTVKRHHPKQEGRDSYAA